ncbi:MAG: peptidyl-alpha-hydroxyglycine alpha-amidating lyase family protein [Candidatus Acidiferrum sp.]
MKNTLRLLSAGLLLLSGTMEAQEPALQPVPELGYQVASDFFHIPDGMTVGEASGVALNSQGHIFLFQRVKPMLTEYDEHGTFLRSIGDGLFTHPHGLRIDDADNIWTTDDGSHLVLKLSPAGRVLLVLGRKDTAAEADWLFNQPTDMAFAKNGDIYVSDGYGNSRVVKFDRDGNFLKSWGKYGTGPGEFNLPHSVAVDRAGNVYVGDRENKRIQIFDAEGNFLKQWTGIGYPYGLFITPDQHVWMIDGGYDRILELDQSGKILGALGEPGRAPGQIAWGHFLTIGKDKKIYVAEVLNWRVEVFTPTSASGKMAKYVPSKRMFWDRTTSSGWVSHNAAPKN